MSSVCRCWSAMGRFRVAAALTVLVLTGCEREARVEAPATTASTQQALNMCVAAADAVPYCPFGWSTCGGTFFDPACCHPAGTNCLTDPSGNIVVCQAGQIRCGLACADFGQCDESQPVGDGKCNLLYPSSPGLCLRADQHADCYDTTTQECQGGRVCTPGVDCSGDPGDPNGGGTGGGGQTPPLDCPGNQALCGNTCFTPGGPMRCISGVLCQRALYDSQCDGVCFDSATDHCVDGTVCGKKFDDTCGGQCISTIIQACCGIDVYRPSTESCCGNQVYAGDRVASCGQCVTPGSSGIGGACQSNTECAVGQCSSVACGAGQCVCSSDSDCGPDDFCWTGVAGIGTNACRPKKEEGDTCARSGQCESDCCRLHIASNPVSPVCRPADKCN